MLVPQHMRCDIEAASWLTSWRQRACDRGWPVVGWLKEKRITLGGEGVRAHGVKESLLIYRTTETMIVGYDVGGSDPAFVILGGRWCGRKPDARSRHFSARAARVTRIALQGKFRNMADEKIQAPAHAITASMRGLRGHKGR